MTQLLQANILVSTAHQNWVDRLLVGQFFWLAYVEVQIVYLSFSVFMIHQ